MNVLCKKSLFIALSLLSFTTLVIADEAADISKVRIEIAKMIPQAQQAEIEKAPITGVYRVELSGQFAYAYVDGDYVLIGDLFNTKDKVNLGSQAAASRVATLIQDLPISKMIVYGPKDAKRHITVFTDIDCGYCRKLHLEVPQLNEAGIQVRYLAYPRAGVGSASFKKYVNVWCNSDQQTALTTAKTGGTVATATCDNPIQETYNLGRKIGVTGTPTIFYDDGTIEAGYRPADRLIKHYGLGV